MQDYYKQGVVKVDRVELASWGEQTRAYISCHKPQVSRQVVADRYLSNTNPNASWTPLRAIS